MRRTALALILAGGVALSGCSDDKDTPSDPSLKDVPSSVATLPAPVASLSQTIGEYVVTPRKELSDDEIQQSIRAIGNLPGQQSVRLVDGKIRVEILPETSQEQRTAILKQLAAIGTVAEGT